MRRIALVFIMLILVACGNQTPSTSGDAIDPAKVQIATNPSVPAGAKVEAGEIVPDVSFEQNGKTTKLSDLRGKMVVLNFWQTTCTPCKLEMPDFEALSRTRNDTVFIGINKDENESVVRKFASELGVTYLLPLDRTSSVVQAFNVSFLPTTYLIDKAGLIRKIHIGPLTRSQMTQLLDEFGAE